MRERRPLLGLGVALASAAAFGTSGAFAKPLLIGGWSPGAVVTLRIGVAALVLLVPTVLALRGRWGALRSNLVVILGYGLLAVAGCQFAYFNAVTHLSVGVALLLEYLAPVLIVGWFWLRGQRPRRLTIIGVVLSLIGLVLVLDVTGGAKVSLIGVLWGLAAAVGLVMYFLLADHVRDGLPPIALAGGGLAVATVSLGGAGFTGLIDMTRGAAQVDLAGRPVAWWVPILMISLVAAAFAYVAGIEAVHILGSKVASFVALTEVLFAVLFAWIVLAELPTMIQLAGGVLVVGGVIAVRADELRLGVPQLRDAQQHQLGMKLATELGTELGTEQVPPATLGGPAQAGRSETVDRSEAVGRLAAVDRTAVVTAPASSGL